MSTPLKFKLLALDHPSIQKVNSASDLSYLIASQGKMLGPKVTVKKDGAGVTSDKFTINVHELTKSPGESQRSFSVEVSSTSLEALGEFRKLFVEHLHHSGLKSIYILQDDVSKNYAEALYPLIFSVENALRAYLIEFMTTTIGPEWWDITITSEQGEKAQKRTNNENFFGKQLIDNKPYLIDFGDLGSIVFRQSSGAQTKEQILEKVFKVDETSEGIQALKAELDSNYVKYFKQAFKDNSFQSQWEQLEKIRNKVAHTGLLSTQDFESGKDTATSLLTIIEKATEQLPSIDIQPADVQAIQETFQSKYTLHPVSEEKFLAELSDAEAYFSGPEQYVSLGYFVKEWLGRKGISFKASNDMAHTLKEKGLVEIYVIPGPDYQFYGIRLSNPATPV